MDVLGQWETMRAVIRMFFIRIIRALELVLERWLIEYDVDIPVVKESRMVIEGWSKGYRIKYELGSIVQEVDIYYGSDKIEFRVYKIGKEGKELLLADTYG